MHCSKYHIFQGKKNPCSILQNQESTHKRAPTERKLACSVTETKYCRRKHPYITKETYQRVGIKIYELGNVLYVHARFKDDRKWWYEKWACKREPVDFNGQVEIPRTAERGMGPSRSEELTRSCVGEGFFWSLLVAEGDEISRERDRPRERERRWRRRIQPIELCWTGSTLVCLLLSKLGLFHPNSGPIKAQIQLGE